MPSERSAGVWSTRVQRELLALTTENDDAGEAGGKTVGKKKDNAAAGVGVLPPFVQLEDRELDVEGGICKVTFRIEIEVEEEDRQQRESATPPPEEKKKGEEEEQDKEGEKEMEMSNEEAAEKEGEEEGGGEDNKAEGEKSDGGDKGAEEGTDDAEASAAAAAAAALSEPAHVILTLDASLVRSPSDGQILPSSSCYPFVPPVAILSSGAAYFPDGSEIDDGDAVDVDLDWTPSLHLKDAVSHVALRVRESVRRGEPYFRAKPQTLGADDGSEAAGAGAAGAGIHDPLRDGLAAVTAGVGESVEVVRERFGAFWGNVRAKAAGMAAEINEMEARAAGRPGAWAAAAPAPAPAPSSEASVPQDSGASPPPPDAAAAGGTIAEIPEATIAEIPPKAAAGEGEGGGGGTTTGEGGKTTAPRETETATGATIAAIPPHEAATEEGGGTKTDGTASSSM